MPNFNPIFLKVISSLNCEYNVPLAPLTTLKVGGRAKVFIRPNDEEELKTLQRACMEFGIPFHILSGGSNTLFSEQEFSGVVVKLSKSFDYISDNNLLNMKVGASTSFAKVCKTAINKGWSPAVGWVGTPGLIGGAIFMNAGTKYGEVSDGLVRIFGIHEGKKIALERSHLNMDYRNSNLPSGFIVTGAELGVERKHTKSKDELINEVENYQKRRKLTQPLTNSAGSFFKNPKPYYAGQLIEKCNLKGLQYNEAQISPIHANFIINKGGASANDINELAFIAQKRVFENFGVTLRPEIRMVGYFKHSLKDSI